MVYKFRKPSSGDTSGFTVSRYYAVWIIYRIILKQGFKFQETRATKKTFL